MSERRTRLTTRPLQVRYGARHVCVGDGLCCTDIHALGPLTRSEIAAVRRVGPNATTREHSSGRTYLLVSEGACTFLKSDGCAIHASRGLPQPAACRRFPLGLIATPSGGRVTTQHRCPCRTLGSRPLLTPELAEMALTSRGRLETDGSVRTVRETSNRKMTWKIYERMEREILSNLQTDAPFVTVFGEPAFPPLLELSWTDVGHLFRASRDGSAGGDALVLFGEAILKCQGVAHPSRRARPWSSIFDRAQDRTALSDPEAILRDFLADELWSLAWSERGDLRSALADLHTRARIAGAFAHDLACSEEKIRPDRAMAEGVLLAEIAGASELWTRVVRQFRLRSPAAPEQPRSLNNHEGGDPKGT